MVTRQNNEDPPDAAPLWLTQSGTKIPTMVLLLGFVVLLAGHSARTFSKVTTPGVPDKEEKYRGFVDFHNAIHFPTKTFLSGKNPYCRAYRENHPDQRAFPLFPPQSLVFHAPFGIFDISKSRILYWVFELTMLVSFLLLVEKIATGSSTYRGFLWLGIALMLTIPFYTSFYMGQLTLQLVVGTVVALRFSRDRPWIAALGLTLAACKPQFAVPLAILLLARYDWKAAIGGGLLSLAVSGVGIAVICVNFGVAEFFHEIRETYFSLDEHPDVGTALENGWRLDLYTVLARIFTVDGDMPTWSKFLIPVAYLGIGSLGVWQLRKRRSSDPLSNTIICLTTLGCVYHSVYDGILLLWPAAMLFFSRKHSWNESPLWVRRTMLTGLVFVMLNVFHLEGVQRKLGIFDPDLVAWRTVASFGAVGIFILLLLSVASACSQSRSRNSDDPEANFATVK